MAVITKPFRRDCRHSNARQSEFAGRIRFILKQVCLMKIKLLPASLLMISVLLGGCATGANRFASLQSNRVRAVTGGRPAKKNVVVARRGKASPAQIQVAVVRITDYLERLNAEDKAVATRTRYLCVCTTQAPDSKGKVTCMVWDTQSQSFVGNSTYELVNPPAIPSVIQFETFNAIYVGAAATGT